MSKNLILDRVKSATSKLQNQNEPIKKAYFSIKNDGDLVENFINNLTANKSDVIECKEKDLKKVVFESLKEFGAKKVLHYDNLPFNLKGFDKEAQLMEYDKSANDFGKDLFDYDTSIIQARYGISNLGIFCITSDEQPRLMSLLPQSCIVLLKKEDIIESINHAHEELARQEKLPQNIVFIAGPSRTADIELQVVLGVHGPQRVKVVLY